MGLLDAPPSVVARRASHSQRYSNNTLAVIGDSITAVDVETAINVHGNGWATFLAIASNGRVRMLRNAGIGGQTSTQIAARFATDILAYKPGVVGIMAGTNDTFWTSQTLVNVEAMIRAAQAAGSSVFLLTQTPAGHNAQPPPATPTATTSTASGSLAAGSYDYVITTTVAVGTGRASTLPSAPVTATLGATGNIRLDWANYQNAAQFNVFRRPSGSGTYDYLDGFGAGFARSDTYPTFIDDGTATPNAAVHPVTEDAQGTSNWSGRAFPVGDRTKLMSVRQVTSLLGAKYGIPVVDAHDACADPATGRFKTYYTSDGTHPSFRAQRAIGERAWADLAPMFPPCTAPQLAIDPGNFDTLLGSGTGTGSVATNGALLPHVTGGAGAIPFGWGTGTLGDGAGEPSLASGTPDGIPGNVLSVTGATDYAFRLVSVLVTTGFSPGDTLRCGFRMKVTGIDDNGGSASFKIRWRVGGVYTGNLFGMALKSDCPEWKIVVFEGAVPASTTEFAFELSVVGRDVEAHLAQLTIENLTTRGLGSSARSF